MENLDILRDTDAFYDIESLRDIYTKVVFLPKKRAINIFIHTEPGSKADAYMQQPSAKEHILDRVKSVNKLFIEKNDIKVSFNDLKTWALMMKDNLSDASTPAPTRMFGFNSHAYDEAMLAYLIFKSSKNDDTIPTPSELRKFSDRLINSSNVKEAFSKDYDLKGFFYNKMLYTPHKDFLDIKDLNEKMRFVSLKRLSAQAGLTIKESSRLSGEDAFMRSLDDICELVAYNTVDTINTYRLFEFGAYLTPFTQRNDLLDRFKENYIDRLAPDSTSAKFIEHVIVPAKKDKKMEQSLVDDKIIDIFYPINIKGNKKLEDALAYIEEKDLSEKFANLYLLDELNLDENTPRYKYNKERHRIEEDLLEMAKEDYDFPQKIYDMYNAVRGCRNIDHASRVIKERGIIEPNSKGKISISKNQIIRNSNSYITFSIGGCHGEYLDRSAYLDDLAEMKQDNINRTEFNEQLNDLQNHYGDDEEGATEYLLTKRDKVTPAQYEDLNHKDYVTGSYKNGARWKKPKKIISDTEMNAKMKKFAKTVYTTKVGHGDVDSLYPTLMTNLGMFSKVLPDGTIHDPYAELLKERLALKAELEKVPKEKWTQREKDIDRLQKLNKLLLNAASGVADASFDNNIRVNNKTIKMRLCGQIILSCVVFKLTDAGSTALSTNTDGVYFTRLDDNVTQEIFDEWCSYFNIGATPEIIDLFVSKDSNNRLEVNNDKVIGAAGSTISLYEGTSLSNNINMPIVRDFALVDYLKNYDHPLEQFDRDYIKERLVEIIDYSKQHNPAKGLEYFQWLFTSNPNKNSFMAPINTYTDELVEQGKTFRGFIVNDSPITMKCVKITKQNKNTDAYAQQIAEANGFINDSNKKNHIKFGKINNLPKDNAIEIHQESLEEISADVLDNLNLETYIDVIETSWESWSESYVEIIPEEETV